MSDNPVVGYHVAEGVSLWNHHLMGCLGCAPGYVRFPDQEVRLAEATRYDDEGLAYHCDTCQKPFLASMRRETS